MENVGEVLPTEKISEESGQEDSSVDTKDKKPETLMGITPLDFKSYIGAMVYGMLENSRAMGFHAPDNVVQDGVNVFGVETVARATEGLQRIFDQNTGDGTIVALGFLGADILLIMADKVSKKLGKKGFDSEVKFLSSLTFGVALASYMESTTFLNNTIDIPGDLFGVALGAAFILTSRIVGKKLSVENVEKFINRTATLAEEIPAKLQNFSDRLAGTLEIADKIEDSTVQVLATSFVDQLDEGIPQNIQEK